jgi:N-acetylmuramic acid 6-phosphate etherase
MKAGTSQKAALNCLSTGIMIRLGFVYRGKMVEMRVSNDKLRGRAVLMVAELAGCDEGTARQTLAAAGGGIKLAVVMRLKSLDRQAAEQALGLARGNLREALR